MPGPYCVFVGVVYFLFWFVLFFLGFFFVYNKILNIYCHNILSERVYICIYHVYDRCLSWNTRLYIMCLAVFTYVGCSVF